MIKSMWAYLLCTGFFISCTTQEKIRLGEPLQSRDNTCLVPSLLEIKQVMAVPCDAKDQSQMWHFDTDKNILRNLGDAKLAWLVSDGRLEIPKMAGFKTMLQGGGTEKGEMAKIYLGGAKAHKSEMVRVEKTNAVKLGDRTLLSPGSSVLIEVEKDNYILTFDNVKDSRCPKDTYCLVPSVAALEFTLTQKGALKKSLHAVVAYQDVRNKPASVNIKGENHDFLILVDDLLEQTEKNKAILYVAQVRVLRLIPERT